MQNLQCNICNKLPNKSTKIFHYISKDKVNWIHDSNMFLLKKRNIDIAMIFCQNCLHANLSPPYNTVKLYETENASQIRKKFYETYYKNSIYGFNTISKVEKNKKINNELKRIFNISNEIIKSISFKYNNKKQIKINILDWGGGLGHVSIITKHILESTNNLKINCDYFDPLTQKNTNIRKIKYDFILLLHVLEHVNDLNKFFFEIDKYIDNSTKLIIEVPDERIEIIRSFIFKKKIFLHFHVNYFTKSSLRSLLNIYGFTSSISYKTSYYRGNKMQIIFGTAIKTNNIKNYASKPFLEVIELIIYIIKKSINKITNF